VVALVAGTSGVSDIVGSGTLVGFKLIAP